MPGFPVPSLLVPSLLAPILLALHHLRRFGIRGDERRAPAPEIVVAQFGAAPPAVDRIESAEILLAGEDRLAERRQRQRADLVATEPFRALVQLEREWCF